MEIQVFTADSDASKGITADHVAFIAANYDGATGQAAPNVIGHPRDDSPAHGIIAKFRAEGSKLFAKLDGKLDAIKQGVKDKTILNRSMMFWAPDHPSNPKPGHIWPKHLGFLGGAAPGIPNMPALTESLAFSDDGDGIEITGDAAAAVILDAPGTDVIRFSAPLERKPEESTVTEEEIKAQREALERDQAAHDERVKKFAADAKTTRDAQTTASVKALVAAGQVLPADEADLIAAFSAIEDDKVIAFSDKAEQPLSSRILAIMAKGGKVAPVNEERISPGGDNADFTFSADGGEGAKLQADAIAERNKRYQQTA